MRRVLTKRTVRAVWIALAAIVAAWALALGWHWREAHQAQAPSAATEPGYRTDGWRDQLRGRTLNQDESSRIY